ncbi:MAG: hypothetical protein SFV51_17245 [Bryobacteraceae bacterium]|nr:hypothetical protein [Bryobacteraceae bacterium]
MTQRPEHGYTYFMRRRDFFSLPLLGFPASGQSGGVTRAGFAETDITPEIGMEQPGGYGKVFHKSLHDPCKVRAAVFDDGRKTAALVGIDALMIPRKLVLEARALIQSRCGIAGDAVMIGASHSHSSGPTGMIQPGEFDGSPAFVRKLAYERSSCADARYLELCTRRIVEAVEKAWRGRRELKLGAGLGHEDRAAFNRRHRMKNGLTYTHPRYGNPDMLDYAGPIDPQVGVIAAWDEKGKLVGCVVNYTCHATTSPGGISANWIYYLEKTIRGAMEADAVVVFLQGASGDITQVNNKSPHQAPGGDQSARLVGGRVGAEAVKVMLSMTSGTLVPVQSSSTLLKIPRRKPAPEKLKKAMELAARDPGSADPTEWTFAKETVLLDDIIRREPVADVEVQAIQVGPVVYVSNPAEYFCQFGLDIKKGSPFPITSVVELANGCVGYVPTEEALGPGGGGYETRLTAYSNLEPAAGRKIANAGIALARKFKPGLFPVPGPAPAFREAWTYGSVPPEVK